MTVETRSFIDVEDFLGFEIECLSCHVKSVFPVGKINMPIICFACREEWFDMEGDSRRMGLNKFFWQVAELKTLLKTFETDGVKLGLRFEVKCHSQTLPKP